MNPSVEAYKDLMLKSIAEGLRRERPGLTHARSYQLAQESRPDLAETFPDEEQPSNMPADYPGSPGQAAASYRYRYDPAKAPSQVPKDLKSILEDLSNEGSLVERVEAIEPLGKPRLVRGIDVGLITRVVD